MTLRLFVWWFVSRLLYLSGLALINLGRSYRALGRYQDALAMREQELDFNRRFNSFLPQIPR